MLWPAVRYLDTFYLAYRIAVVGLKDSAEELLRSGVSKAFVPYGLGHHLDVQDVSVNQIFDSPQIREMILKCSTPGARNCHHSRAWKLYV